MLTSLRDRRAIMSGRVESLMWKPCPVWSENCSGKMKGAKHVVVGPVVNERDVDDLSIKILLNFSDEEIHIPYSVKGASAGAD